MYFLWVILFILLICFICYYIVFFSPHRGAGDHHALPAGVQYEKHKERMLGYIDDFLKLDCEKLEILSYDGKILRGRYYHVNDNAGVDICFHGYRGTGIRDFCGGSRIAMGMGRNVILVDQRAHGESGGQTICFGIKERCDALEWTRYCNTRFGSEQPILLSGLSMGAATVLMASNLPLPANVCCIIADAPYSAPYAIIEKVGRDSHYPMNLVRPFVYLGAWIFGRFNLGEITAKDAIAQSKLPILLLHGEEDHFVPCEMSREMARCGHHIRLATFPGAGHGLCYMVDPVRYEREIYRFLSDVPALSGTIDPRYVQKLFET